MSRVGDSSGSPRAIIHKKILDVAAANPDASMEAIATEVSGASTDLVERVLDEYGDPVEDAAGPTGAPTDQPTDQPTDEADRPGGATGPTDRTGANRATDGSETMSGTNARTNGENRPDLSDKQAETLRAIRETPDCTQADLAERFDVTRATISRWLNDIPGFEWSRRAEFAASVLPADDERGGDDSSADSDVDAGAGGGAEADADTDANADETGGQEPAPDPGATDGTGAEGADGDAIAAVRRRLGAIERRIERLDEPDPADTHPEPEPGTGLGTIDADLAHKVVHACMHSDRITEAEELRLLRAFMGEPDPGTGRTGDEGGSESEPGSGTETG